MFNPFAWIDLWLQGAIGALTSSILWGIIGGAGSMAIYARCSPQTRLDDMKNEQREIRKQLKSYDGELDGLYSLIRKDLAMSMTQIRIILIPFLISCFPVFVMMFALYDGYEGQELITYGPDWMHGFEFTFITAVMISSLIVKIKFKIH